MVEKKSTTKAKTTSRKRVVKKAKEPEPASDIQQVGEQIKTLDEIQQASEPVKPQGETQQKVEPVKRREINWDVIGFSSAAITLLGAGFLFMMGWAYQANWYGYFGVSMTQVNVAPQQVLIQSLPATITMLTSLFASVLLFLYYKVDLSTDRQKQKTSLTKISFFTLHDLLIILFLWAILNICDSLIVYAIPPFRLLQISNNDIYEIWYFVFLTTVVIGPLLFILLIAIISTLRGSNSLKDKIRDFSAMISDVSVSNSFILFFLIVLIIMSSLARSAMYGINDAAHGRIGSGGWRLQPVLLSSHDLLGIDENLKTTCRDSTCLYGSFGLIGENSDSFILIKWKDKDEEFFRRHQGLYIIPKSESTYLIPFTNLPISSPSPQVLPSLTSTLAVKPSFTPTIRPTLRPTITPTFTPIPSQP